MCEFSLKVRLCGCEDPHCKERKSVLDQAVEQTGHILRIAQYDRVSGMCMEWFHNHYPDRLVLRYGLPENSFNSKQDCKGNKKLTIHKDVTRDLQICKTCERTCTQPKIPPSIVDKIGTELIVHNVEQDRRDRKQRKLEAQTKNVPYHGTWETLEERDKRRVRKELYDMVQGHKRFGYFQEQKSFNIPELLLRKERKEVMKRAIKLTEELPETRRFERAKESFGGLYFTSADFVDGDEIPTRDRGMYRLPM